MKKYLWPLLFALLSFTGYADSRDDHECHLHGNETMDAVVIMNATGNVSGTSSAQF